LWTKSVLKNIFFVIKNRLVFMLFFCNLWKSFLTAFNLLYWNRFFFFFVLLLSFFFVLLFWVTYFLNLYLRLCAEKLDLFLFNFFMIPIFVSLLFIFTFLNFLFLGLDWVLIGNFFFRFVYMLIINFFSCRMFIHVLINRRI